MQIVVIVNTCLRYTGPVDYQDADFIPNAGNYDLQHARELARHGFLVITDVPAVKLFDQRHATTRQLATPVALDTLLSGRMGLSV